MAEIRAFHREPQDLNRAALLARLEDLRIEIARLDEQEPADMTSEAYEAWGDQHEELEDQVDELLDRLDELREEK